MPIGRTGNEIPKNDMKNRIGNAVLEKGTWNYTDDQYFYLIAWDFAVDCTKEQCPLYDKCTYVKAKSMVQQTSKCRMHLRYMKNVIFAFVDKMRKAKRTNEEDVIKLGYQLLPLYSQLFKFKMWEHSNQELVIHTSRGDPKVHPVYKEIREIIKTISGVWREIGESTKKVDPAKVGDGAFIDAMYEVVGGGEEETEEVDNKGSGIDFSEEDNQNSDEGVAWDIEQYNTVEDSSKKTWPNKKKKKKRKRKAAKPKPKAKSYRKLHQELKNE